MRKIGSGRGAIFLTGMRGGATTRRRPRPVERSMLETCVANRAIAILDQPAFNRDRLKAEKLIDSKALEQLIRVQVEAGCSGRRFPRRLLVKHSSSRRMVKSKMVNRSAPDLFLV
jgi:hypothetical protein